MKFTLPITLLAVAVSVDAAAVADQDKRYCSAEGQACDTVKRAAEAFSGAIQQNTNLVTRDTTQGETAWIARRQLHELALAIAASHDDPAAFYSALGFQGTPTDDGSDDTGSATEKRDADADPGWCRQFLGMPCWKRSPAPDKVKREAEPWCTQFLGMPCWKRDDTTSPNADKREAEAKADAGPDAEPWCTQFLGQPCWKRTSSPATTTDVSKREADAEAAPWCKQFLGMPCWKRDADPGWCRQFLGMPCWKRNGDDATSSAVEKREAEAEAEPDRFCTRFTGSSCWKRDGGAVVADEVKRCSSEGQACWKAKRAAAAVINAIDQGNAQKMARDADPGWCRQFLGMPCWKRAVTCNGPAGVCTKATRDLHAMYNAARTIIEA